MYILKELISLGIWHYADLDGELIEFKNNLVVKQKKLDHCNIFNCQYFNMRVSSFNYLEPIKLCSLIYADISFTKIEQANF